DCRHRSTHLRWEQVKTHRAACRNNGTDPDDWSPDDIIRQ
uniref:Uncharacterized protein n=1 Tax=Caenorhabditis japonica TaxID=281687 RepID=A0A8R1EH66_CAEJA